MPERERPKQMVRTGEVYRKAEDLSQINAILHRIQGTANNANQSKPGSGGTTPAGQAKK
jgi:hypothetical protein